VNVTLIFDLKPPDVVRVLATPHAGSGPLYPPSEMKVADLPAALAETWLFNPDAVESVVKELKEKRHAERVLSV
jgi:hypothetical protein